MHNSQPEKEHNQNESPGINDRLELMISEGLSLLHDPSVGEGKTRDMAKGLFVCYRGRLCAGESSGLGLPVLKTAHQTIFPTLASISAIGQTAIEKKYRMDRVIMWHVAGKKAPALISAAIEHMVNEYMKRPILQHCLLKLRTVIIKLFALHSVMEQRDNRGYCLVTYETAPQGLSVQVDGRSIKGQGQLIVLNEVDGRSFNRLRTGMRIWQDTEVPAWLAVPFNTVLESPSMCLGISISPGDGGHNFEYRLYCGRETALGLDWAGLAIASRQRVFDYRIDFHT